MTTITTAEDWLGPWAMNLMLIMLEPFLRADTD
jgi:hypothetical protein